MGSKQPNKAVKIFHNSLKKPIYITVEPFPECFELEPNDKLTLIYTPDDDGDVLDVNLVGDDDVVVWACYIDIQYFINDEPAEDRSWRFKHQK